MGNNEEEWKVDAGELPTEMDLRDLNEYAEAKYPRESHLVLVGRAHWSWSRLEWNMIFLAASGLDTSERTRRLEEIATMMGGQIVTAFINSAEEHLHSEIETELRALAGRRNTLAHARPASLVWVAGKFCTVEDRMKQLNRWDPKRGFDGEFLTDDWLSQFATDCEKMSIRLEQLFDPTEPS